MTKAEELAAAYERLRINPKRRELAERIRTVQQICDPECWDLQSTCFCQPLENDGEVRP